MTVTQIISHTAALMSRYRSEDKARRKASFNTLITQLDPFQGR
jgi:hypothetical protein